MSVLTELSIFPIDKGISVSKYVSKAVDIIKNSGIPYKLTSMGTIIETKSTKEAFSIIEKTFEEMEKHSDRIYATIKIDLNKNKSNAMDEKIKSIESKIGNIKS